MNTYGYVDANPVRFVDPLGLDRNVFFFDNASTSPSPMVYSALVYVLDTDTGELFGPYSGSIHPDQGREECGGSCPTVAGGTFRYKRALFPFNPRPKQTRYPALSLGTVPAVGPNLTRTDGKPIITGVWVHRGGRSSTGSEGCLTISPGDWPAFMSRFPKGTSGVVEVAP